MRRLTLLAILAALVAGCGDSSDDRTSTSAAATTTTTGPELSELSLAAADTVRACLLEDGLTVLGGPRSAGDNDAPDVELLIGDPETFGFVAFYADDDHAERNEARIRKDTEAFGGSVVRRGALTLLWMPKSTPDQRAAVEACLP
jgi:hypothetical protein